MITVLQWAWLAVFVAIPIGVVWGWIAGAPPVNDDEPLGPNKSGGLPTFFIFVASLFVLPLGVLAYALYMIYG